MVLYVQTNVLLVEVVWRLLNVAKKKEEMKIRSGAVPGFLLLFLAK